MGTRFVIGRAGSGKTRWCFDRIVHAMRTSPLGAPIFWILPRQATFAAERALTAELGAFTRARVLSFDELSREIVAECGQAAVPMVSTMGRQMILGLLLRRLSGELGYFGQMQRQSALAVRLDAMFSEFERAGHDEPEQIIAALANQGGDDVEVQSLLSKLRDMARLYGDYETYLGQDRLDPHRRTAYVLECVSQWRQMRDAAVFVDGFLEFTDHERQLTAAMAQAAGDLSITLPMDPSAHILHDAHHIPDELGLFHRTELTYRQLYFTLQQAHVPVASAVLLKSTRRFEAAILKQLERHFADEVAGVSESSAGAVRLIEAVDRRSETESAARLIRQKLMEGYRLRDIAVLARDLSDYEDLIETSFAEHEIPFFLDRRRTVGHHPLVQLVRSAFVVARDYWPADAMTALIKSGLTGINFAEADELLQFMKQHRVTGSAWNDTEPWSQRTARTRDTDDADGDGEGDEAGELFTPHAAQTLRVRLSDPLRPFVQRLRTDAALPVRQIVVELFGLLDRIGVRTQLQAWIAEAQQAERYAQAGEHEQVWAEVVELFDQMVDLIGDEVVTLDDFLDVLDSGLEKFDLALTPPTVDQVLVGQADRTRDGVKVAILLGMNDGQFPRVAQDESLFADGERRLLSSRQIDVGQDTERRLLNESLTGYIALTRASDQLVLIRSTSDSKARLLTPSVFWRRVQELFPQQPIERAGGAGTQRGAEQVATPRQLITGLMRWVRNGAGEDDPDHATWPALYQWMARYPCNDDVLDRVRHGAWPALSAVNIGKLSPAVARRMFASPLMADARELEVFAACPYQHFVRYGLGLNDRSADETDTLSAGDTSRICHDVMRKIADDLIRRGAGWNDLDPDETDRLIASVTREAAMKLREQLHLTTARQRHVLDQIEWMLRGFIRTQQAAERRSDFRPAIAGIWYGYPDARLNALVIDTPGGNELQLKGRIDRIDRVGAVINLIDYRMRSYRISDTLVWHGLDMQLLADLLAIRSVGAARLGDDLAIGGALSVPLLRQYQTVDHPRNAVSDEDDRFDLRAKFRGMVNDHHVDAFDRTVQENGASDVMQISTVKAGGYSKVSDVVQSADLATLLDVVRDRLAELADGVIGGSIAISPYRIGTATACAECGYRAICRFDKRQGYRKLEKISREKLLKREEDADVAGDAEGEQHGNG